MGLEGKVTTSIGAPRPFGSRKSHRPPCRVGGAALFRAAEAEMWCRQVHRVAAITRTCWAEQRWRRRLAQRVAGQKRRPEESLDDVGQGRDCGQTYAPHVAERPQIL